MSSLVVRLEGEAEDPYCEGHHESEDRCKKADREVSPELGGSASAYPRADTAKEAERKPPANVESPFFDLLHPAEPGRLRESHLDRTGARVPAKHVVNDDAFCESCFLCRDKPTLRSPQILLEAGRSDFLATGPCRFRADHRNERLRTGSRAGLLFLIRSFPADFSYDDVVWPVRFAQCGTSR